MPTFDIVKKSDIEQSYRVARIMSDFDVQANHASEHFVGEIKLPEKWNVGVIVGASGTGKTTIARELFSDYMDNDFNTHVHKSVVDDMPKECSMDEIERMFYAVGFGSVPSWLKPYKVLSNGEKMRVDVASALLAHDYVVFDEFTSVVDRNVAQVTSLAVSKAVKKMDKKFVAVTCHYDVLDWLEPDWVFDTATMQTTFQNAHTRKNSFSSVSVGEMNGRNLDVIII